MAKIDRPYLDRVAMLQVQFPILKTVTEFLMRPSSYDSRLSIVEFSTDGVQERVIADLLDLGEYWKDIGTSSTASDVRGRLYVVEDISAEYLEALGSYFSINPVFFLRHLYVPVLHKHQRLDPTNCPPQQLHCFMQQESSGLSLRYYDVFERDGPFGRGAKYTADNIRRKLTITRPYPERNPMLSILRNISLYVKSPDSEAWSAILLVDPPIRTHWVVTDPGGRNERLELCHFRPYLPSIAITENLWAADLLTSRQPSQGPARQDKLFDFVTDFWNRRATRSDLEATNKDPRDMLKSLTARAIIPTWMTLLSLVFSVLSNHEYTMFEFEDISLNTSESKVKAELANLRAALGHISRNRRRTWWYIEHIHVALQNLGFPNGRLEPQYCSSSSRLWAAAHDLATITDRLHIAKERIESLTSVVRGACSILSAQQATLETKQFNTLTSLAAVFIPITTCAGIFSMGEGYLPGQDSFWIFWVTAVPLTTLVVLVIFNLSGLHAAAASISTCVGKKRL